MIKVCLWGEYCLSLIGVVLMVEVVFIFVGKKWVISIMFKNIIRVDIVKVVLKLKLVLSINVVGGLNI